MRAGRLRQRLTILRPVETTDAAGQPLAAFEAVAADVPASVVYKSAAETPQETRTEATGAYEIRVRGRRDVRPGDRLEVADPPLLLEVASAGDPYGRGRELLIIGQTIEPTSAPGS